MNELTEDRIISEIEEYLATEYHELIADDEYERRKYVYDVMIALGFVMALGMIGELVLKWWGR